MSLGLSPIVLILYSTCPSKIQDDRHIDNLTLLKWEKNYLVNFYDNSVYVAMFLDF